MVETGGSTDARHLAPGRAPSRPGPNLSGGWLVMILSGLIAAVLFFFATQQSSNRVAVATFATDVSAGNELTINSFDRAEVAAGDAQLDRLIPFDQAEQYVGWFASGPSEAGDLIQRSDLRQAAASDGRRSMSIPVEKTRANNGQLRAGDRVDVILASDGTYAGQNLEILSVDASSTGALAGNATFTLVAAVTQEEALRISQAISNGDFDVIRTTGATPSAPATDTEADTEPGTTTTTTEVDP